MNKVYLVINHYSNESGGCLDIENITVFGSYEDAKKFFEEEKKNIQSFNLQYSEVDDEDDYYCEWESGEYMYYHELVKIEEKEVE